MNNPGYRGLLKDTSFEAFLWTQLLGAFNDNVFKMIVSIFAVNAVAGTASGSRDLALAGAVFVLPFLLFAGYAGYLADRFSKTRVLQITKAFEMGTMLLAIPALLAGRIDWLLVILFLLATQANFFGPAKYGILPEMLDEAQITRANGLLELTTFVAIVVGTSFGTLLYEYWRQDVLKMGLTLLAIAVIGSLASLKIRRLPASDTHKEFHWNPLHEIHRGRARSSHRQTTGDGGRRTLLVLVRGRAIPTRSASPRHGGAACLCNTRRPAGNGIGDRDRRRQHRSWSALGQLHRIGFDSARLVADGRVLGRPSGSQRTTRR